MSHPAGPLPTGGDVQLRRDAREDVRVQRQYEPGAPGHYEGRPRVRGAGHGAEQ